MEQEIIKLAMSQGLWAVLFVALLFYVLRENSKRESELRKTIDNLAEKFEILKSIEESLRALIHDITEVKDDVDEIKSTMYRRKESA
ncbi:hypothetical protein Calow_0843 [Caldicellulosiruptor owensensis OL]|uniref:Bacteriocin n=1 Tax=Caldicellulosiruptor owensensis (strain ATCC 700167 / DSM 13100 / OL) TaxID=632518 RepID=E4Q637_CALOW|nr:BhlA/UviB family holin-like peptide [Caldicellulosiruptor owensensis]ADQ04411.1 hypothetical protein Calow_0843 [Caldicellulosiruptor owensensis OL]